MLGFEGSRLGKIEVRYSPYLAPVRGCVSLGNEYYSFEVNG